MIWKIKKTWQNIIYANDLVGCFGKLSVHSEFIKYNILTSEIAALDQWYQSAYHYANRHYGDEFKNYFQQMPLYHSIVIAPNRLPLLSSITPSCDQNGRLYPLVIFRLLENPLAQEFSLLIPLLYADYFSAVENIFQMTKQKLALSKLFSSINNLKQSVTEFSRHAALELAVSALKSLTLDDLQLSLLEIFPNFLNGNFIESLSKYLKSLKSKILASQNVVIQLPISNDKTHLTIIIFWLQLLKQWVPEQSYWQIFWQTGGPMHHSSLQIYLNSISHQVFIQLLNQPVQVNELINITLAAYFHTNNPYSKRVTEKTALSLLEILYLLK